MKLYHITQTLAFLLTIVGIFYELMSLNPWISEAGKLVYAARGFWLLVGALVSMVVSFPLRFG